MSEVVQGNLVSVEVGRGLLVDSSRV